MGVYDRTNDLYLFFCISSQWEKKFLSSAQIGIDFILHHIAYEEKGFIFFRGHVDKKGDPYPQDDDKIHIFTQVYVLTGLIAFYEITHDPVIENLIEESLRMLFNLFYDEKYGGFYDAISKTTLAPIKHITDSKSTNGILDPLHAVFFPLDEIAFQSKYCDIQKIIVELSDLTLRYFVNDDEQFIREIFSRSWNDEKPKWKNPYCTDISLGNTGTSLKVIWSLLRGWDLLSQNFQNQALKKIRVIQNNLMKNGTFDHLRGGWFDVMNRQFNGSHAEHMWHTNKIWWQQKTGILSHLLLFLSTGNHRYLSTAKQGMMFWVDNFFDKIDGGIFSEVSIDGIPKNIWKGSWLKCSYHETELSRFLYLYQSVYHQREVIQYFDVQKKKPASFSQTLPTRIPKRKWKRNRSKLINSSTLKVCFSSNELKKEDFLSI